MKRYILFFQIVTFLLLAICCFSYRSSDHTAAQSEKISASNVISLNKNENSERSDRQITPTPTTKQGQPNDLSLKDAQSRFGAEHDFARKSPLPPEIWKWIRDREENSDLKVELLAKDSSDSWVFGSQIDLNDDNQADYVVMAYQPPLAGANITTFWVFLNDSGAFRCILKTSALEINVSKRFEKGFRSITGVSFTAVQGVEVVFAYDGRNYQPVSRKTVQR